MTARVALTYRDYEALVVEILSRSTATADRGTKRQLYARYGVSDLWLVDLEAHAIETYVLREQDYDLRLRAAGTQAIDLPPFVGLGLVPSTLWP